MPFTVDYTNAPKGTDFSTPIPTGEYVVMVTRSELNDQDDPTYIKMRYKVQEGDQTGRIVFDNIFLSDKSAWRHNQFRAAIGLNPVTGEEELDEADYLEEVLIIKVEPGKPFNGKPQTKVSLYKPVGPDSAGEELPWHSSI